MTIPLISWGLFWTLSCDIRLMVEFLVPLTWGLFWMFSCDIRLMVEFPASLAWGLLWIFSCDIRLMVEFPASLAWDLCGAMLVAVVSAFPGALKSVVCWTLSRSLIIVLWVTGSGVSRTMGMLSEEAPWNLNKESPPLNLKCLCTINKRW